MSHFDDAAASTADSVSEETLASLSAEGRRVVRGMARGGWASGSPAEPAVRRTVEHLGAGFDFWNGEQVAGEPRAFYPSGQGAERFWATLALRLDALPRKKAQPKVRRESPPTEHFEPVPTTPERRCLKCTTEGHLHADPCDRDGEPFGPLVGTVWVRPSGEVWRLREYRRNRLSNDPEAMHISYDVMLPRDADPSTGRRGGFTSGEVLPDDAEMLWSP